MRPSLYNIKSIEAHLKDDSKTIICYYDNVGFKEPLPKYILTWWITRKTWNTVLKYSHNSALPTKGNTKNLHF